MLIGGPLAIGCCVSIGACDLMLCPHWGLQPGLATVEYLLEAGADIAICDKQQGMNAVHRAAMARGGDGRANATKVIVEMCKTMSPAWAHTNRAGLTPAALYTTNTTNCTFLAEWAQGAAPWTVDGHSRLPEPLHNSVCELLAASKLVADFCRFVLICAELC